MLTAAGLIVMIVEPRSSVPIEITPGNSARNKVGIYGAVKTPGIYEYTGYIRVEDAVVLAGSLTDEADAVFANLS